MEKPLCIDHPTPRFSWVVEGQGRGLIQSAYRILVAESPASLEGECPHGILWDSGWVESGETVSIPYGGPALRSRRVHHWVVRIRDPFGSVESSGIEWFATGLADSSDWGSAKWIGIPGRSPGEGLGFGDVSWIWADAGDSGPDPGRAWFRRSFRLDGFDGHSGVRGAGEPFIDEAILLMTGDSWYGLYVNGHEVARGGYWVTSHHIDVSDHLVPGANTIAVEARAGGPNAGMIARLSVKAGGVETGFATDPSWRATATHAPGWEQPGHDDTGWPQARIVAPYGQGPWGTGVRVTGASGPCPHLRRDFRLRSGIRRAVAYASAKGVYELRLNGQAVGDDVLAPGWTDYRKRVQYQAYDVTGLLSEGENRIGAILGDGWYAGNVSIMGRRYYGDYPLGLLVLLVVEYDDGSSEYIVTDDGWVGAYGPILRSDMQNGEAYDACLELGGWDLPDRGAGMHEEPAGEWVPVIRVAPPEGALVAQSDPGVKRIMGIKPVSVANPKPGVFILDFGQNMVGWVRMRIPEGAGCRGRLVRLRFGEMLLGDGTLYTANLRDAQQTDTYRMKGSGEETFEPRFTFHGFRYVEVTGYPGVPDPRDFTGVVVHSALEATGSFECSNEMVNRLYSNILWGQRGNFVSVPTDCPQRDERMGWTGDTQVFAATACYNMGCAPFYAKWLRDLADARLPDGRVTDVVPYVSIVGAGNAAWGDAATIVPWTVYLMYGDERVLEEAYPSASGWVDWLERTSDGLIRPDSGYGDWLSIGADTPKDLLSTAFFARSARIVADMAGALGLDGDYRRYSELAGRVREAFIRRFTDGDGGVAGETQTGYLLALRFDLLPKGLRNKAMERLLALIAEREGHLSTGFVGVGLLCPTLSDGGADETAYGLALKDTYPSWGYSIRNGATTVWERWNSYTAEHGFGDVGMNSFNHYSLGSVGEWLFGYAGGIRPDPSAPGFRRAIIDPRIPDGGIDWVKASYDSVRGTYSVSWTKGMDGIRVGVTVPHNAMASIRLPATDPGSVSEGGRPLPESPGLRCAGTHQGRLVLEAVGGSYDFLIDRHSTVGGCNACDTP